MVLRSALAEHPVDSNTSKMYILENSASSRVFTSTIPYLSTNTQVEWNSPSPAARKKARVFLSDDTVQECCCILDPQFAPRSITKLRSASKTKVTPTTISGAPAPAASFLNSKVFVKMLDTAAIKIQTQARRAFPRQRYLNILTTMKLEAAATEMQALCRGGMCRMHVQVRKLGFRLLQSDRLRKTQLEGIEKAKERQMEAIYKEEKAKMKKRQKCRTDLAKKTNENVRLLRKANKTLRSSNKKLQRSMDVFQKLNSRLFELTAGFGDESANLKTTISKDETESSEWEHLVGLYKDRILKYKDMIDERSDRRICERLVTQKTLESIANIVRIVEDESEDEELVREVVELGESTIVRIVQDESNSSQCT